jgi:hypothetical protein
MLTTQTSAVALDLLENIIGQPETNDQVSGDDPVLKFIGVAAR